jgi:hypothetical protein
MLRFILCGIPAMAFVVLLSSPTLAQTGGGFDLTWSTVDCGGAISVVGEHFALAGTAGQPDTGNASGGNFVLEGGFWYGGIILTGVEAPPGTPTLLVDRLYEATPNPFNPRTEIAFDLAKPGKVQLMVYDLHGRLVRTLAKEGLPAGHYTRSWDGTDQRGITVASGVYFVRLDAGGFHARQKVVLLK